MLSTPLINVVANSWTDAQLGVHCPSSQLLPSVDESPVFDRAGAALLDDLEDGPIRVAGIGLAPLLGDGLGVALNSDVDLEEASPPVPNRRFRGRTSAS